VPRGDGFAWHDDDPEGLAVDWDAYETEMWLRENDGRWQMAEGADWDAVLVMIERRQRARLRYRRELLDGVCLEGSWGVGAFVTILADDRYL
jgi:hypothetical protein